MTRFSYTEYISMFRSSGTKANSRQTKNVEGAVRSYSFVTGYGKRCIAWRRQDGSLFVTPEPEEEADPIVVAIRNGDVTAVKELVKAAAWSLTEANREGWLPVHEAAHYGQDQSVEVLLKARPELIDKRTLQEQTPLLLAAAGGHTACVQLLLGKGADPEIANKNKETPLYKACERESVEIVELLLRFGGGANQRCSQGWTALHEAVCRNNTEICQILVQAGANVRASNAYGVTPLFMAAQSGRVEALDFLINNRAEVDSQAGDGATALYEACKNGHMKIVELLLSQNADANKPTRSGLMPLHIAAQNGHDEIVSLLVPVTSKARVRSSGISPLHLAAEHDQDDVLEVLIEAGFDVNARLSCDRSDMYEDRRGTALYFAVANGNVDAVSMLLKASAKPDLDMFSPLLLAVRQGSARMAALLLEHGADANAHIPTHPTVFPAAAVFCVEQPTLLKVLLDSGCDGPAFFRCVYGDGPHPPSRAGGGSAGFDSSALHFRCGALPFGHNDVPSAPMQFCEMMSSPSACRWAGPFIDLLLDYVGNVKLCSRLNEHLDHCERWAVIRDKSKPPRDLKHLCRLRIREQVGVQGLSCLDTLPLPRRLIMYLNNDFSKDEC